MGFSIREDAVVANDASFRNARSRAVPNHSIQTLVTTLPIIRKYDEFGTFVRNVGREGEGPGEYRTVGAMRVLPDGRLVIGGRGLVSLYAATGEFVTSWNVAGALFGRPGIPVSPSGSSVYVLQRNMNAPLEDQTLRTIEHTLHYVQYDLDGTPRDTINQPDTGLELAMLISSGSRESARMTITQRLPFTPQEWKILRPSGHFIVATADDPRALLKFL